MLELSLCKKSWEFSKKIEKTDARIANSNILNANIKL